jgi:alpha-D-ribose 1-methylphosphonate 5-triphosphate diphosphatase
MEQGNMWISELKLVLPDRVIERGALRIVDGKIETILEGDAPNGDAMNAQGLVAIPGLIDLHGDMLERDIEPRPRARFPVELAMHELDKRLAATGVTTAYAAVGFAWRKSDLRTQESATEIIEVLNRIKDTLLTDCRIHARFEVNNPETVPLLDSMLKRGLIDLVSIMDHTPGQGQYNDGERYVQFLKEWLGFTEDQLAPIYERLQAKIAEVQTQPRDWSLAKAIIETALAHNVIVASHDDDTIEKVETQGDMGVTIAEFPINVESARAAQARGMHIIMGAPNAYRGSSNTGNLSAMDGIRAGVVDILASDYYPAAMLQTPFKIARAGEMALHDAIRLVTANAADACGLHDRGRLQVGCLADIVLVEEGEEVKVRATLRKGEVIYSDAHGARLWQTLALPTEIMAD